jgi:hypothetical protein
MAEIERVIKNLTVSIEIPFEKINENKWWITDGHIHGYLVKILNEYGYICMIGNNGDIYIEKK